MSVGEGLWGCLASHSTTGTTAPHTRENGLKAAMGLGCLWAPCREAVEDGPTPQQKQQQLPSP